MTISGSREMNSLATDDENFNSDLGIGYGGGVKKSGQIQCML